MNHDKLKYSNPHINCQKFASVNINNIFFLFKTHTLKEQGHNLTTDGTFSPQKISIRFLEKCQ